MDVKQDKLCHDPWEECKSYIFNRIGQLNRHAGFTYFGFTTDPVKRARKHQVERPWARRMILLWKARTPTWAKLAEQELIARGWAISDRCDNIRPGGEGVNSGGYLYMLVDTP